MASSIQRLAVYHSGRAEAVYSDGSAAILHPGTAPTPSSVTFFASNGVRQRLLSSCLSRNLCGKIVAAATIRDRFHPIPSVLSSPAKQRLRRLQPFTHVVWPCCDTTPERHEDGSIVIESLDRKAKLQVAPHGRTYVVEWWQPVSTDCSERLVTDELAVEQPCSVSPPNSFEMGTSGIVGYEHIHQVQCFSVAEQVELTWVYPLFLALMFQTNAGAVSARLVSLKTQLEDCLALGALLDSGKGVTVPLPDPSSAEPDAVGEGSDHVSPAVSMGELGEGSVRVLWTPSATLWLHRDGEATIDASDAGSNGHWLLESSLKGRFWTRLGPGGQVEVIHSEIKSGSTALLRLIDEAVAWLQHNATALPLARPSPRNDLTASWIPEVEISEGKVHLTIFTSGRTQSCSTDGKPRLLRLLFPDGARLSFTMPNSSAATPLPAESALGGQHFRLITPSGEALHRSFADPFGAEFYVATLRAMLRRHGESRKPCGDLTNFEAVTQGALRRSLLACKSIGRLVGDQGEA